MRMGTCLSAGLNISFSVSSSSGREGQGEDGSRTRLRLLPNRARVSSSPSSSSSSYAARMLCLRGRCGGSGAALGCCIIVGASTRCSTWIVRWVGGRSCLEPSCDDWGLCACRLDPCRVVRRWCTTISRHPWPAPCCADDLELADLRPR